MNWGVGKDASNSVFFLMEGGKMFKDYNKYLQTSLKVYLFVLVVIVILKVLGLNYFGIDANNEFMCKLNDILVNNKWLPIIKALTILSIQFYFYLCIVCERRKLYIWALIGGLLNVIIQIILMQYLKMNSLYSILSISIMIIIPMIVSKKIMFKRQIKYVLLITLYQVISLLIRNVSIHYEYGNYVVDTIMNLDQLLMLAIYYTIFFMKKEELKCQEQIVGLSLLKKINLKTLLQKLQRNLHSFKKKPKVEKISLILYIIFSLIWNLLSLLVILIVAQLNNTFIECIFILTSFWLSKRAFGKAFHLSSMAQCFVVSNLTYYCLNRITTPLGISIFVPILLGVGLSYVTSKLVKKTYKPLYKGMPKELFEETILKVTDKNSTKYKICYDSYIEKESDISLSFKYNYSIAGIRKIKDRINAKIKELK